MNYDAANANRIGCMGHTVGGVPEQRAANALRLPLPVHSKPAEYRDRDGVGHISPESPRCAFHCNCA